MKKRITAVLLCAASLLLLCSCGKYAPVKVNGSKIGKGTYNYFLDRVNAENPSADEYTVSTELNKKLSEYVAVNSEFTNRGLKLDAEEKINVAKAVENKWHLYSAYYNEKGVSKQDIYNIELSSAYRTRLMLEYYSDKGEAPVTEQELEDYFKEHFIAFRTATGFLTTVDSESNTVPMDEAEKKTVTDRFSRLAADINEGKATVDSAGEYYENAIVTQDIIVISADSDKYPEGFYEKVAALEDDKAGSFVIGEYVFTAQKFSIVSDEDNFFEDYKTECLKALKGEEFDGVILGWSSKYTVSEEKFVF